MVNFIVSIIVHIDVAKSFGKGTGFGIGLVFLGFIFYPILAFGDVWCPDRVRVYLCAAAGAALPI